MVRSWVKLIWQSFGVALVAAAAQLGIAQALGIVRWTDHYEPSGGNSWSALLAWIVFLYAVAVLGGAAVGRRAARRPGRSDAALARIIAALSAALGAAAAVPLVMLQAGDAVPEVNVHPELLVSLVAATGVVAGLVLTLLALFIPPIAGGARASVGWIWLAAIGSAVAGILSHRPYASPRLAIIDVAALDKRPWWPDAYVMVVAAALIALAVALMARFGGANRFAVTLSGLAGPGIVTGAYAIAGVNEGDGATFMISLYALAAGLVVAMLVALPTRPDPREEAGPRDDDPTWGEGDRYRPGNYLAEARPGEIVAGPYRGYGDSGYGDGPPARGGYPTGPIFEAEPGPADAEPPRTGSHRAEAAYPGGGTTYGSGGQDFREYDYPTDEYPTTTGQPAAPAMGQPPQAYNEGASEWLRTLGGHAPAQRS